MITTDKLNWYAAYTRVNQELVIKKKLDESGVENYLPQEERVRETPLGRKKIRVLLIHGLIFIRTDKATSFSLLNRGDRVRVIKGPLSGLEGELVRLKGHKRVVVRLDGVASIATSYIPSSFLEKIE